MYSSMYHTQEEKEGIIEEMNRYQQKLVLPIARKASEVAIKKNRAILENKRTATMQNEKLIDQSKEPMKRSTLHNKSTNDWFKKRYSKNVRYEFLYFPDEVKKRLQMMAIFDNFDEDHSGTLEIDEFLDMFIGTYICLDQPKEEMMDKVIEDNGKDLNELPIASQGRVQTQQSSNASNKSGNATKSEPEEPEKFRFVVPKYIYEAERFTTEQLKEIREHLEIQFTKFYQFVTEKDNLSKADFINLALDKAANEFFLDVMKQLSKKIEKMKKTTEQVIPYSFEKMISYLGYRTKRDELYTEFMNNRDKDIHKASIYLEKLLLLKDDEYNNEDETQVKLMKYRMKSTGRSSNFHINTLGLYLNDTMKQNKGKHGQQNSRPSLETSGLVEERVPLVGGPRSGVDYSKLANKMEISIKSKQKIDLAIKDVLQTTVQETKAATEEHISLYKDFHSLYKGDGAASTNNTSSIYNRSFHNVVSRHTNGYLNEMARKSGANGKNNTSYITNHIPYINKTAMEKDGTKRESLEQGQSEQGVKDMSQTGSMALGKMKSQDMKLTTRTRNTEGVKTLNKTHTAAIFKPLIHKEPDSKGGIRRMPFSKKSSLPALSSHSRKASEGKLKDMIIINSIPTNMYSTSRTSNGKQYMQI